MRFRILGPIEAWNGERWVPAGPPKQKALLAVLLTHPNRVNSRDALAQALWRGGTLPKNAAGDLLSGHVGRLRRLLGDDGGQVLVTRAQGYQLLVPPGSLDSHRAMELLARGRAHLHHDDAATAAEVLRTGLDLWRGRSLDDASDHPKVLAEADRLDDLRGVLAETWIEAELRLGHHRRLLPTLRAMSYRFPGRERLRAQLMVALNRSGRRAEALAAYDDLRRGLADCPGIDPSPPLRRLYREIHAGFHAGAHDDAGIRRPSVASRPDGDGAPGGGTDGTDTGLPREAVPWSGRRGELARLTALLTTDPLAVAAGAGAAGRCVVHGAAGVGKTALAVRTAQGLVDHFPDGRFFVDLAGGSNDGIPLTAADVAGRLLRALGAPPLPAGTTEAHAAARLSAALTHRRALIVLDNALDGRQVRPLLPAGPRCAVVVTSRRPLAVPGLPHLRLGALAERDAIELLGRVGGPDRVAAEPDAAASIVRRCGGVPLAVRLLGAQLAAKPRLPVHVLAGNLVAQYRRDDTDSRRPVRAAFLLSYRLLRGSAEPADEDAARTVRMLGLLDGPDVGLPVAARLLDRDESAARIVLDRLVEVEVLRSPAPGRYAMHDLLRGIARECAEDDELTSTLEGALVRALSCYLTTGRRAARLLRRAGPSAAEERGGPVPLRTWHDARTWLELERGNLFAAAHQAAGARGRVHRLAVPLRDVLARAVTCPELAVPADDSA